VDVGKVESEGKLRFYDPPQLARLKAQAHAGNKGRRVRSVPMMGHRHITTTERYLHYAPDPEPAAKLSGRWRSNHSAGNIVSLRTAAA
jgi:hypothetical protein